MRKILSRLSRVAAVIGIASALGGCATIPERAWANGQAMSQSRAHQAAARGDMSIRTRRELVSSASPLRLRYQEVPYPAFGQWWW